MLYGVHATRKAFFVYVKKIRIEKYERFIASKCYVKVADSIKVKNISQNAQLFLCGYNRK